MGSEPQTMGSESQTMGSESQTMGSESQTMGSEPQTMGIEPQTEGSSRRLWGLSRRPWGIEATAKGIRDNCRTMAKIFLSHSSVNNAAALAVAQWLAENGWDDFFLDIEPARGLSPGERWQEALKAAADRCEAVLCLISPAWLGSRWCLAELLLAKQLGKLVFGAFIEPAPLDSLPREMTAEWQLCDLVAGTDRRVFQVGRDPIVPATEVSFAVPGLDSLKIGLQKAGLDASTFPWPPPGDPDRAPYRGFKALEAEDAAVFFGREADVVRGLDTLRRLRERDVERLLILLGASGAGKSSFLRAGLWPRLGRDDRHFLPLPVIRPERAALSGPSGLAASLEAAFRGLRQARSRADIRSVLAESGGLDRLLPELQSLAGRRLGSDSPPPTVIVGIDQAEELLSAEGRTEAETFLSLLAQALDPAGRHLMAVFGIRSDSFERLQAEPLLARARWALFDLRPLARAEYKAVVEGPAARATAAGRKLRIDPELTNRLLAEAEGADALPLLAFTLERLFVEHGGDGTLGRLLDYETLGGLRNSIEEVVKAAFAEPGREPAIPADEAERTRRLKECFIPWLARIDPDTEERKRRVARWEELPTESRPLIERLISVRLLLSDRRRVEGHDEEAVVVEVAHEALLRQWPTLTAWLDEAAADLKALEATRRAAGEWRKNNHQADWLTHTGDRLRTAEALRRRPDFDRLLGADGIAYLEACRRRDDQAQAEREAQTRRVARAQRRTWALLAVIAVILLGAGTWIVQETRAVARQSSLVLAASAQTANDAGFHDRALRLALLAAREGWLSPAAPEAEAQLARAAFASPLIAQTTHDRFVTSAAFSSDGRRVVSASVDGTVRVWNTATGKTLAELKHAGAVYTAALSPDGQRVAASDDHTAWVWDTTTKEVLTRVQLHDRVISASFSTDGRQVMSVLNTGVARRWDAATGKTLAEINLAHPLFYTASVSSDGRRVVISSKDGYVQVFDAATGQGLTQVELHASVNSASFSPGGRWLVTSGADGTVRVLDAAKRRILAKMRYDDKGLSASFSPDGRWVVSTSDDGIVRVWDPWLEQPVTEIKLPSQVLCVVLSPDGRRVVSGSLDGTIRVADVLTGQTLAEVTHSGLVESAAFSPDGRRAVSGSQDGTVRVWDTATGKSLAEIKHQGSVNSASFSPDGRRVVSASADGAVVVWDSSTGKSIASLKHNGEVTSATFSPDGQQVVSATPGDTVLVWSAQTGRVVTEIDDEFGSSNVSFSPDGQQIFGTAPVATLKWNAATGKLLSKIRNDSNLTSASLSADHRRLVGLQALGGTTLVQDTATGQTLAQLRRDGEVRSVFLSKDGRRVVTGAEQTIRVWDTRWLALHGEELITAACREKLNGAKTLTKGDTRAAPLLRDREGEDVCAPPAWLDQLKDLFRKSAHS